MTKRATVELRTGVRTGFGLDYFNTGKKDDSDKSNSKNRDQAGEISGWIECDFEIAEDSRGLICGPEVRAIDNREPDDFRIDLVQLHIARIGALIADIKKAFDAYAYLVSWNDPILTGLSFVFFVWICLRFNLEFIGRYVY